MPPLARPPPPPPCPRAEAPPITAPPTPPKIHFLHTLILTHSQNVPPIMAAPTPPKIQFIYILAHSQNHALFMFLLLLLKYTSCSLILTLLAAPTPPKTHFLHPPNFTHSQNDFVATNKPDWPNLPSASHFLICRFLQGVATQKLRNIAKQCARSESPPHPWQCHDFESLLLINTHP